VHAPSEEKRDHSKNSFYKELEQAFEHFPMYHMKILLGDFDAKDGRENIFKPIIGNVSIHQDINDNGVRIVKFATSNIWFLRARCSCTETFLNTPRPLLTGRLKTRLIIY